MKKKRRKLLAVILAAAMLVPQSVLPASAADLSAAEPVYVVSDLDAADVQDVSASVESVSSLEHGTVNIRYRMAAPDSGLTALYSVSDQSEGASYAAFYVNNSTVGLELRSGGSQLNTFTATNQDVNDTEWHTLTWVFGDTSTILYVDGDKAAEASTTAFFSSITDADAMAVGGLLRSGTNWHNDLSISEISVYEEQFTAENVTEYVDSFDQTKADTAYEIRGVDLTAGKPQDVSEELSGVTDLSNGTVNIRYRMNEADSGLTGLYSLSDRSTGTTDATYAAFYVNNNTVGLELRQANAHLNSFSASTYANGEAISINDTYWHTLTWVFGEADTKLYVDGKLAASSEKTEFFSSLSGLDTMTLGGGIRDSVSGNWYHACAVDEVSVYSEIFTEETVKQYHAATRWTPEAELDMTDAYVSETEELFYSGYEGSSAYRIPSLLTTTEGTQLAFADERNSGTADTGNIDAVVRRKEAGETAFSDPITLVDLPNNGNSAAFSIDMVTVQDKETGTIFAFVDMFPESAGLMQTNQLQAGVGYKEVDGVDCQILYTNPEEKEEYGYIANIEDGIGHVLNNEGKDTGYTVIVYPEAAGVTLQEKGNLYKDGGYKGNIYMKSGADAGELRVLNTSYFWMVTSDDDGLTWSDPVDITPQVKEEWALFFGTGPGVGIQLHAGEHEGRLIVPIYTANVNVSGSQSSAVIYSDDHGKTWKLGDSPQTVKGNDRATMNNGGAMFTESQPVQLDNGDVLLFMRNTYPGSKVQMARSKDGGATWSTVEQMPMTDVYCQLSVIQYTKNDGSEWVLLSNPSGSGRYNGKLYLGAVQEDGTIEWDMDNVREVNAPSQKYLYSCLTLVDNTTADPKFALMYEDDTVSMTLKYFEFDENWLKAGMVTPEEMDVPQLVSHDIQISEEGTAEIALTFDQVIMAAGEPQLTLTMGSEEIKADYVSGSGTDTVVFTAAVPEGTVGILKLTGLELENGILENIHNMSPAFTEMDLFANTELDLTGTEVTYTTQHSSSTAENTDGAAVNVIDGNPNTYWHSTWGNAEITLPQSVTLELPEAKTIYKVDYLARQNSSSGRIKEYGIEVSTDGTEFTEVAHGILADTTAWQEIEFVPTEAQYIRFVAYEAYSVGTGSCSLAELRLHEYSDGVISPGNKEELQSLVDAAAALAEDDYSDVTWAAYAQALAAAQTVLDAETASQSLIDRTSDNLKDAQKALTDISEAAARFEEIRGQEADYTPDSWALFEAWMTENEPKLQDAETSKDVTDLIVALAFQAGNLVERADKEALQDLWEQYTVTDPLTEDGYDKESWEQYELALGKAEDVLADENASADEVAEAIQGLTDARTTLKADMSELKTLYDTYSKWTTEQYLPNNAWDTLQDALGRAAEMLEEGTAAPADVKELIEELTTAAGDVDARPDTGGLKALYDSLRAELGDLSAYMSEGAEAMKADLENAEKVLNDPQTEQQVEDQKAALEDAYAGLVLKATEDQILEMAGLEQSLEHKDLTGLSEEQLAQVKEIRDELREAISADEISAEYAEELIEKAEAAMRLSGQEDKPQTPSEDKPADGKPSASDDKEDAGDKAVQTGDAAGYGWIILMLAAGTVAVAAAVLGRQGRKS